MKATIFALLSLLAQTKGYFNPNFVPGRSGIVWLFEWKFADIALECERFLGPNGFAGVQISSPAENAIVTNPLRPWWERYNPVSYIIASRSGNEQDFSDMVTRCNNVGVRTYVEIIMNNMGGYPNMVGTGGSTADGPSRSFPAVPYTSADFHATCSITTMLLPFLIRNCAVEGLPDLNQSGAHTRDMIVGYLNHLISLGVAGFRINSAKFVWPSDLKVIYDRTNNLNTNYGFAPNSRPFIFQDVADYGLDAISKYEYSSMAVVSEYKFLLNLGRIFRHLDVLSVLTNWVQTFGLLPSDAALVFVDSPDSERGSQGSEILTYKDGKAYILALIYMLAVPYGHPIIMSSYEFKDVNSGPPMDANQNIVSPTINPDGSCGSGYVCQHRWTPVSSMVAFSNNVGDAPVTNVWTNGQNQLAFARDGVGFVAINSNAETLDVSVQTGLVGGVYCNVLGGPIVDGTCAGQTVVVGDDGIAAITITTQDNLGAIVLDLFVVFLALVTSTRGQFNPYFWPNHNTIVYLLDWKYSDVALECENFLGPKGFGGVQVSSPAENAIITDPYNRPWWERFHVLSYIIGSRSGNQDDFADMTARCNKCGVRVFVDAVFNNMGGLPDMVGQFNPYFWPNHNTIVYLLDWKYSDVALECENFLGPKGFGGVQVSSPSENAIITDPYNRPWWERFHVLSYIIGSRSGNQDDFADMTARCNKCGVRVFVDAIFNEMGGLPDMVGTAGSTGDGPSRTFPAVPYDSSNFHPPCPIQSWLHAFIVCSMVTFRNQVGDANFCNFWSNGNNQIAFAREGQGFIVFNNNDKKLWQTLQTTLPEGTYCDVITGYVKNDECTGRSIEVADDGTAEFIIYTDDPNGLFVVFLALVAFTRGQFNPYFWPGHNTIVYLLDWKYSDVALECENFLGPKGFGGVQVSSPSENAIITDPYNRPWWERFHVLSYIIGSRSGNQDDFADMTARCNKCGVRVFVDAVFNNMGGLPDMVGTAGSTGDGPSMTFPAVPYDSSNFHPPCPIQSWLHGFIIRNCEDPDFLPVPDLDQSQDYVREQIVTYLNNLISLGAAGFRIFAAKHMWPTDLEAIYSSLSNLNEDYGFSPNCRPYIYQDVIDLGGEAVNKYEYIPLGLVSEYNASQSLADIFRGNRPLSVLATWGEAEWNFVPSANAIVFVENEQNELDTWYFGRVLNYKDGKPYIMAIAFLLAHPFGNPLLNSDYEWTDPNEGPPMDDDQNILSPVINKKGTCDSPYVCQHRWPQVCSMVTFRNQVGDANFCNFWSNGNNQIAFAREGQGFIVFNNNDKKLWQTLQTTLPEGTYCDVITGYVKNDECTGRSIEVADDGTAEFIIYTDDPNGVIAIHTGQMFRSIICYNNGSSCAGSILRNAGYDITVRACWKGCLKSLIHIRVVVVESHEGTSLTSKTNLIVAVGPEVGDFCCTCGIPEANHTVNLPPTMLTYPSTSTATICIDSG
uniref:alpha-amylase n=1 Tax=Lutzomyia longipalpis TaxID=7200 RepID=A0A1B0EY83_LUTLO